ncbi:FAD synthase-like [Chelonus insularis]|uniref:FAD synthase-like n=1 Tax=Chelonus insularis TaxID=460826 RepID=UPI00158B5CC4|nr:FAD synthase-like [Chelonus insularis]
MVQNNQFTIKEAQAVFESAKKQPHINYSLLILEKCLNTYSIDELFMSFNGGKDCTVILHLTSALLKMKEESKPLTCLYVRDDPFPEVDEFVNKATRYYGIKVLTKKKPIKAAVEALLNENKDLKASLMGTRRDDPGSQSLEPFKYTDPSWPKIMRVNPILDWSYSQVWQFILEHQVPYCSLYDQGYSSLGDRNKTVPNPLLKDPDNPSRYLPAYMLIDESTERHGR